MSEVIASLIAKLSADTSGLDAGLAGAKTKINEATAALAKMGMAFPGDQMGQDMQKYMGSLITTGVATKQMTQHNEGLMGSLNSLRHNWMNVAFAIGGVVAVSAGVKKLYELGRAGAEIEYTTTRFARLSEEVGTTSGVFINQLRRATKGTMSDAALMKQSGDLMALGLANTTDEAIRLSAVATALNMDMGQLNLTLANESTRRFDQLGVGLTGFKDKLQAIKDTGVGQHEAFKLAFLQQAEEQVLRVGNAADSSLGSYNRLGASWGNFANAVKQSMTETFIPFNAWAGGALDKQTQMTQAMTAYGAFLRSNPQVMDTGYGRQYRVSATPPSLAFGASYVQYQQQALAYAAAQNAPTLNALGAGTSGRRRYATPTAAEAVSGGAALDTTNYAAVLNVGTSLTEMTAKYNDALNQLAEKLIDQPKKFGASKDQAAGLTANLTGLNDMTGQYNSQLAQMLIQLTDAEGSYGKNAARVRELREGINKLQAEAAKANDEMLLGTMKNAGATDEQQAGFARASGLISEQAFQQAVALTRISDAYLNNKISAQQAADAAHGVQKGLSEIEGFNAIAYVDVFIRVHGSMPNINMPGNLAASGGTVARRALGGPVNPGGIYGVTEYGEPEVFNSGGKQYLLAGRGGYVSPSRSSGGGGGDAYAMLAHVSSMFSPENHARALVKEMVKFWPTA
jgi:hypothetical protein